MISIVKPRTEDIPQIERILTQWNTPENVEKYVKRISDEIDGNTEFNMRFWVAKDEDGISGISGISDPLPEIIHFAKTSKPAEIKIIYVDGNQMGKGVGKTMVEFLEKEANKQGYTELMVRSAKRYKYTAWGFYKKIGYPEVAELPENEGKELMTVFSKLL